MLRRLTLASEASIFLLKQLFAISLTLAHSFLLILRGSASQIQARRPNQAREFAQFMTAWGMVRYYMVLYGTI